jgi:hypothetical protein
MNTAAIPGIEHPPEIAASPKYKEKSVRQSGVKAEAKFLVNGCRKE